MTQDQQTSGESQSTEVSSEVTSAPVSDSVTKDYPLSAPGTIDKPAEAATVKEKVEKLAQKQSLLDKASETAAEGAPPPYTPNFKFKAVDKEHEFDPLVRDFVKNEAIEKHLRELYEKSHGLDSVKGRFQELKTKHEEVSSVNNELITGLNDLRESYQAGDFDSFFKKLNIPQEKVLQWVLDKAHYNQLPPEQKAILDSRRQAEERARMLEKQNQTLQSTHQEQLLQAREYALSVGLERPDVKQVAELYDARQRAATAADGQGRPTFRDLVISQGQLAATIRRVDISPEEAIQAALNSVRPLISDTPAEKPVPQMIPVPKEEPRKVQTLPNVGAKTSASPVIKKYKSIEDLKKRYKEITS